MDWGITERFEDANHNPIAAFRGQAGLETVHLDAKAGETVTLSADGSSDPDGDTLSFRWFPYREAGTLDGDVVLSDSNAIETTCSLPDTGSGDLHIILEVSDNGPHVMRAYRRIVIHVA